MHARPRRTPASTHARMAARTTARTHTEIPGALGFVLVSALGHALPLGRVVRLNFGVDSRQISAAVI